MRRGTTFLLALLVILLGGYIYLVEQPALERETAPRLLVDFDPDEIDEVRLETRQERIVIQRGEGDWQLLEPVVARADARAVDTLVRSVARTEQGREVEAAPQDAAPFGFVPPSARLRLLRRTETLVDLEIGSGTPIGFQTYVRRPPDPAILLAAGTLRVGALKTPDDFRDRTILEILPGEVRGITLTTREGTTTSLDFGDPGWKLVEPEPAPASATRVRALLDTVRGMRAIEFIAERGPDAENRYRLSPPALHLRLDTADGPRGLRVGDPVEVGKRTLIPVVVDGEQEIFLVPSHVQARLSRDFDDLRERPIVEIQAAGIAALRVRSQGRIPFLLERTGEEWSLERSDDGLSQPLASMVAERLLDDVLMLSGEERFAEKAPAISLPGLAPRLEVDFLARSGDSLGRLLFFPNQRAPGQFLVALRGRGPVYTIPAHRFDRIDRQIAELAPKQAAPPAR